MSKISRRYLILLPRQLGDILLGTPIARAIKQNDPQAKIFWYCHPMGKQLLEHNSDIDRLLLYPLPPKILNPVLYIKYFWGEICFAFFIRLQKFDVTIDVMNNPRTAISSWISRAPIRISFSTRWIRNIAFTHLLPRSEMDSGYLGFTRLKLLQPLGFRLPVSDLEVQTTLEALQSEKLKVEGYYNAVLAEVGGLRAMLLSPTHRHPVRRWPGEYFVELALKWIEKYQEPVIWLWGPGELDFVTHLHTELKKKLGERKILEYFSQVPPLFSLRETAYLSGLSAGWIGNSNGLSHVAVAGGAKTIQIHGPTRPENWTQKFQNKHAAIQRKGGCIQCGKNICQLAKRECLIDLSVDSIFVEMERLFNRI